MEGWGLQDQDVAQALTSAASGPPEWASQIGEYLPLIITDAGVCRRRLLELLGHAPPSAVNPVLKGLASLGETVDDVEVVDAVLQIPADSDGRQPGHEALIKYYSWDDRVRELAQYVLNNTDDRLSAVATAYGADDYFRTRIIELVNPLPAHLGKVMVLRLGEEVGDDFSLTLLESYNDEADADARVQASISYHNLLKTLGRDTDTAIRALSNRIVDYGEDWTATRHAALSGLLVLGRLDVMMNAQEKAPNLEDKRCRVPLSRGTVSPSVTLIRLLLKNWEYIRATFGEEFWFRLGYKEESSRSNLWYYILPFAGEYPQPRAEVIELLKTPEEKGRYYSTRRLHFLNRALPKSSLLRQYCMSVLAGDDNRFDFDGEESVMAAEIIASQFRDDEVVRQWLAVNIREDYGEEGVPDNIILLLCEGWPDSTDLERFNRVTKERHQPVAYPVYYYLRCAKDTSEEVMEALEYSLLNFERSEITRRQQIFRPILRRLQADDRLLDLMIMKMQQNPSPTEKATLSRLIAQARGAEAIRTWCVEELAQQALPTTASEIGVDISIGDFMPVTHVLLDILNDQYEPHQSQFLD